MTDVTASLFSNGIHPPNWFPSSMWLTTVANSWSVCGSSSVLQRSWLNSPSSSRFNSSQPFQRHRMLFVSTKLCSEIYSEKTKCKRIFWVHRNLNLSFYFHRLFCALHLGPALIRIGKNGISIQFPSNYDLKCMIWPRRFFLNLYFAKFISFF